ncbi:MAG: molybdopterin-dependent oxidoreductase [Thermodesulfobacteriota bacterium]|nr:molybdopterin-dependent oxidoreductase [Thermodesulfobacteriota bacterium]
MEQKIRVEEGTEERVVRTLCGMCATHCGIELHLRGETIIKVKPNKEHPLRRLCVKSQAIPDLQYSRDRLLYPLKRANGKWYRISWDEALDNIIDKLNLFKEKYGPESLVIEWGHGQFIKESLGLMRCFARAYGTPNMTDVGFMCGIPSLVTHHLTVGEETVAEISRAQCVINWALNSWHSQTPARQLVESFRERGVKLIVIDPRITHEAEISDLHLRPRPGTDLALMLAMINLIISEDLYDKEFVEKWTVGFDELAEAVKDYSAEWAEGVTWVPAKDIEKCARMFATIKPACISTVSCMEHTTNGFQWLRAEMILSAITGNLDVAGGNKLVPSSPHWLLQFAAQDRDYKPASKSFSADEVPVWEEFAREAHGAFLADTILTEKPYPLKALIVQGSNPLRSFSNTNKLLKAFKKLDFIVVMDLFMTDLADKFADIVLPAATFLEHNWLHCYIYGHLPLLSLANKVFEPAGECRGDADFWIELGRRMGYEEYFPWKSEKEATAEVVKSIGKTIKDFQESPKGFFYAPRHPDKPASERDTPFRTPSGKVEIYSEKLAKMGYPPLPVPYEEPVESPITKPEIFKEYPLFVLAGTRNHAYEHTWGRNFPTLRRITPDPLVQVHPKDAKKCGIEQGEWVYIESPRGRVKMKADISEDIMEGVISAPHGWGGESNINLISNDEDRGPVLALPMNMGFAGRLRKIV